jgi:hypothetical protein
MAPDRSPGSSFFLGSQTERYRESNPAPLQCCTLVDEAAPGGGKTEISGNPESITRSAIAPLQPSAAREPPSQ